MAGGYLVGIYEAVWAFDSKSLGQLGSDLWRLRRTSRWRCHARLRIALPARYSSLSSARPAACLSVRSFAGRGVDEW